MKSGCVRVAGMPAVGRIVIRWVGTPYVQILWDGTERADPQLYHIDQVFTAERTDRRDSVLYDPYSKHEKMQDRLTQEEESVTPLGGLKRFIGSQRT